MIYAAIIISVCAVAVSVYCIHRTIMQQYEIDFLEERLTHTLESLDFVISKLDLVRESLKSIKHDEDEVDESDWWKRG